MDFNFWQKNKPRPVSIGAPISMETGRLAVNISHAKPVHEETAFDRLAAVRVPTRTLREFAKGSGSLSGTLAALWSRSADTRREFMILSQELRKFYIYNSLLRVVTEDVLNPDSKGNSIRIVPKRQEIKDEIKELDERLNLNSCLGDVVRDTIDYGEYSVALEIDKDNPEKGVLSIQDTVDQMNFLAMYSGSRPSKFLVMKQQEFVIEPPQKYAHFLAGSLKLRYKIENVANYYSADRASGITPVDATKLPEKVRNELPDFIRVGEPMFRGMSSKIRDLQLLEQLIPAIKLNELTQAGFISVKMPMSSDPKTVMATLERYEDLFNIPVGIDLEAARIELTEIMSATQKIRMLPDFSDGKGQLNALQLRPNQSIDDILNAIKDIREVIMTSIGVPPAVLFGSSNENRLADLRKYSRYVKMIQVLRRSIRAAIEHIILVHLSLKKIPATREDFDVEFINNLADTSEIEQMEIDDMKQAIVKNVIDMVDSIQSQPLVRAITKPDKLAIWVREKFQPIMSGESFFMTDEEILQNLDSIKTAFAQPTIKQANMGDNDSVLKTDSGQTNKMSFEQNVLVLLKKGMSPKEIALSMGVDLDKVTTVIQNSKRSESK